jgi:hypothetical protein
VLLPREVAARAPTLDALRQALPSGMTLLPRQPGDDPVIVESWLSMSDDSAAGDQDALRAALLNWTDCRDLVQGRHHLEAHPELMTEATLCLLEDEILQAAAAHDHRRVATLGPFRTLLRNTLQHGVAYAFDEFAAAERDNIPPALREVVFAAGEARRRMHREPSGPAADEAVAAWRGVLDTPRRRSASPCGRNSPQRSETALV